MKKNLIFLTLLISVLMVSVVSAGITGYVLKRGISQEFADVGTVSVREVSGDTATFQFTDPKTGATETLSGAEGQIVTTSSGTQVEVATVTEGNLFRRGVVEVNVVPASASGVGASIGGCKEYLVAENEIFTLPNGQVVYLVFGQNELNVYDKKTGNPISGSFGIGETFESNDGTVWTVYDIQQGEAKFKVCQEVSGGAHTHLVDYSRRSAGINAISNTIYENAYNLGQTGKVNIPLHGLSSGNGIPGDGFSDIVISVSTTSSSTKHLTIGAFCEQDEVALGGGYDLSGNSLDNSGIPTYTIRFAAPFYSFGVSNLDGYVVQIEEPYEKASTNYLDESGIQAGIVYVNCARIEPTLHQFSLDY